MEKRKQHKKHDKEYCEESTRRWVQERVEVCEQATKRLVDVKNNMVEPVNSFNQLYSVVCG